MATVKELRATAKAKGLKGYSKLNKDQLIGLIIRHNLEVQKAKREAQQALQVINEQPAPALDEQAIENIYNATILKIKDITDNNPERGLYDITPLWDFHKSLDVDNAILDEVFKRLQDKGCFHGMAGTSSTPSFYIPARLCFDNEVKKITTLNSQPAQNTPKVQEVKPVRVLPTPKSRKHVFDFSKCTDAKTLRKLFKDTSIDTVKFIAESYREFQPLPNGKRATKKFYVDAIVKLYFPDEQPEPAPKQEVKKDRYSSIIISCGSQFTPGKIYVIGTSNWRNEPNPEPKFIKVIRRKNDTITIQEVSSYDFQPMFKPISRKVEHHCVFRHGKKETMYETIYIPNSEDLDGLALYICSLCEYHAMFLTEPGYDVDFDETAYNPDYQENFAVRDDIPEPHEPEQQETQKDKIICFDYDDLHNDDWVDEHYDEICNNNTALLENCATPDDMRTILDGVNKCTLNCIMKHIKDYAGTTGCFCWTRWNGSRINYTHEEMVQELIDRVLYCREDKRKHATLNNNNNPAPEVKNSAPASRQSTRKISDDGRQFMICFDEDSELENIPATPAPKQKKTRRTSRPKNDDSRQLLIIFDEQIISCKTYKRMAA